ncbi:substrate-binding domain-containing protein [Halorubrum ezzemoulense]|uniref:Substrate-binding domain-containing protein n=1 Tax=Halorubrum ezzemoulense TaxID=337243 RepID=A0ABT4Z0B7_HALEZ|nr:substrate-binding domain-containing protein [Halorubrum ezzemoulense]MDB2243500.1 substrate-binding domain-containing protein [Halorubrum ezzemoulense]MDB2251566.1 substrate-binding domain-containing protein [Halorubrum ezzemoulense]MDB2277236.1 substrate-binding domain-containing protein [Halorubrum ezzemoulense]MDB2283946.1 substrate-binding domain-containing protein [Halorubrum ezzemoulense]MDB2288863.1 substrate-binding domain-containing protein [Halorubrum ezzemoulense]
MSDRNWVDGGVSRRKVLITSGALGTAGLAGCSGSSDGGSGGSGGDGGDGGSGGSGGDGDDGSGQSTALLNAEGSSTVYPISNTGSSYWNSNAPPSDGEYWGANDEGSVPGWDQLSADGADDMLIADYFAAKFGFEPTDQRSSPPFPTTVGLSHSGTGCEAVTDGLVDIGNSSGPITAELDWTEEKAQNTVVDNVVGRDGQPVVVSSDVSDAGVAQLTGEEIRGIYQNEITNWNEIDGVDYDQEIYAIGRAEGSGTDTSFRLNMLGAADASMSGVDTRFGQNQQVAQAVSQNEGAIAYMALAFTSETVIPISIEFDGTLYETSRDAENTIFDSEYPLNRDLHMYTLIEENNPEAGGYDRREAAFVNMFLNEFGQSVFVEGNNYIPLPTSDLQSMKDKVSSVATEDLISP